MLRMLTTATVLLNRSKNLRHSSESRQPLMSSSTKLKAATVGVDPRRNEGHASGVHVRGRTEDAADADQNQEDKSSVNGQMDSSADAHLCWPGVHVYAHARSSGALGREGILIKQMHGTCRALSIAEENIYLPCMLRTTLH